MRLARYPFIGLLCAVATAAYGEPVSGPHRSSLMVWAPNEAFSDVEESGVSNIIYVNGCFEQPGCLLKASSRNDARTDESTIPTSDTVLSTFAHGQEVWDETVACLREVYGPYNVEIVTADPGDVRHHEAILAGVPGEVGLSEDTVGVTPVTSDCSPKDNIISLNFANVLPPSALELCWTVAQESAHAFGLDHVLDCQDPMTYNPLCGQKFFRDRTVPCGEFIERPCRCATSSEGQNSHRILVGLFGPGQPPPSPELRIELPRDGDMVVDEFAIYVTAVDKRSVHRVELYINGWLTETAPGFDFANRDRVYIFTPEDLPDGILDIEARAYNDLGSMSMHAVTVTKGEPCTTAETCQDGQACQDGRCKVPLPEGQIGDACERGSDCQSLFCPEGGGTKICSVRCVIGVRGQCPEGFDCLLADDDSGVCWPSSNPSGTDDGGGCCDVRGDRNLSPGHLALIGVVAWILARRSKRRRLFSRGYPPADREGALARTKMPAGRETHAQRARCRHT